MKMAWTQRIRISPSARIGIMLSILWFLCDTARGWHKSYYYDPRNTMTQAFTVYWGNIGVALNPSRDPHDWPVKVIAMALLFFLPIFIWWAILPVFTAMKRRYSVNR
jgi:hypothetical protein